MWKIISFISAYSQRRLCNQYIITNSITLPSLVEEVRTPLMRNLSNNSQLKECTLLMDMCQNSAFRSLTTIPAPNAPTIPGSFQSAACFDWATKDGHRTWIRLKVSLFFSVVILFPFLSYALFVKIERGNAEVQGLFLNTF